ncbi:MAG: hypothetical protein AB7F43_10770 [Bacteriovoracia bacterium]
MRTSKPILFIGNTWESLDHKNDTSLHLACHAIDNFRSEIFWGTPENISFEKNALWISHIFKISSKKSNPPKEVKKKVNFSEFHSIHWRLDPPVTAFHYRLWSLMAAFENKYRFYNRPSQLLSFNEKFLPLRFKKSISSIVFSNKSDTPPKFFNHSILKPSGDAASRGVIEIEKKNIKREIKNLQNKESDLFVLQPVEKTIRKLGETRCFFINGKNLGAIKKIPNHNVIFNFDKTDSPRPQLELTRLSSLQQKTANEVGLFLKKQKIYFATLDLIGDKILEINITSPGLAVFFDQKTNNKIAKTYWKFISIS